VSGDAFADLVPREILTRKKMGFGVPLGRWFGGALRSYVSDALLPGDAKYRAYVAGAYVEDVVRRHMTGEDGLVVLPEVAAAKMPPFHAPRAARRSPQGEHL
jgi:hypothetical protein